MVEKDITGLNISVPLSIFREGNRFVAYSYALDLSTSGESYEEVRKRFNEIVDIFFEEIIERGTLNEVLGDLGWIQVQKKWNPPVIISQEYQKVKLHI